MSETTLRAFLLIVYVIGLDVGNGSGERSVFGLRDLARCQARLCQRAVFGLRDWARCWTRLIQCAVFDLREWTIFFDLSFLLGNKMPM